VFARNASKLIEALKLAFPHFIYATNATKPRHNSFEISLIRSSDQEPIQLWTGVKLTPRAKKFPEAQLIVDEINKHFL
jgi:hypothetical protein